MIFSNFSKKTANIKSKPRGTAFLIECESERPWKRGDYKHSKVRKLSVLVGRRLQIDQFFRSRHNSGTPSLNLTQRSSGQGPVGRLPRRLGTFQKKDSTSHGRIFNRKVVQIAYLAWPSARNPHSHWRRS
jgi:hypothetical protein